MQKHGDTSVDALMLLCGNQEYNPPEKDKECCRTKCIHSFVQAFLLCLRMCDGDKLFNNIL